MKLLTFKNNFAPIKLERLATSFRFLLIRHWSAVLQDKMTYFGHFAVLLTFLSNQLISAIAEIWSCLPRWFNFIYKYKFDVSNWVKKTKRVKKNPWSDFFFKSRKQQWTTTTKIWKSLCFRSGLFFFSKTELINPLGTALWSQVFQAKMCTKISFNHKDVFYHRLSCFFFFFFGLLVGIQA